LYSFVLVFMLKMMNEKAITKKEIAAINKQRRELLKALKRLSTICALFAVECEKYSEYLRKKI